MQRTLKARPQGVETRLAMKLAASFHYTTGLDLDDLYAEALLAYAEAQRSPRFDPERSKFTTYAYWRMRSALINFCEKQSRHNTRLVQLADEGDEDEYGRGMDGLEDTAGTGNPERRAEVAEFLEQLDPDSRQVCELVLAGAPDYAPLHWHQARTRIKRELADQLGWSKSRIAWVLAEVRRAVTGELGGRPGVRV